jgi:hypothetical protein
MANAKVGGEVDAYCTKCRMTLAHTVLAMLGSKIARVRCNTCGGDHSFRGAPGAAPRSSAPANAKRTTKAEKIVISFQEQLASKDLASARVYNIRDTYAADEVINHPTFGLGIVTAVRADKVEVAFKADAKTLVHGRGGGAQAKPAYQPPAAQSTGPADKAPPPSAETPEATASDDPA